MSAFLAAIDRILRLPPSIMIGGPPTCSGFPEIAAAFGIARATAYRYPYESRAE